MADVVITHVCYWLCIGTGELECLCFCLMLLKVSSWVSTCNHQTGKGWGEGSQGPSIPVEESWLGSSQGLGSQWPDFHVEPTPACFQLRLFCACELVQSCLSRFNCSQWCTKALRAGCPLLVIPCCALPLCTSARNLPLSHCLAYPTRQMHLSN